MKIFTFLCEGFHLFEQQFSGCAAVVSLVPNCYTSTAKPWTSLHMDGTAVISLADFKTQDFSPLKYRMSPSWCGGLSLGPKLHPKGEFFGS